MENEQVKQPSYEELFRAYANIAKALDETKLEIQAIKADKILERLSTMMHIVEHKDKYPKTIYNLAIWHMKQIMARPK